MIHWSFTASIFALCAPIVLAGCTTSGRRELIVYSPHGKEMLSAFEQEYEKAYPDVDVKWLDMGAQDVYDRIRTERQNPQADVWWGAPSTTFERAEAESLLEQYVPSWDSVVIAQFKSHHGFWYGTFVTPEVIMYNTRVLQGDSVPTDWDDLLNPRWRGKIIIRYPLSSGTMRSVFSALILREAERKGTTDAGFQWLRGLDANTKSYASDPTQLYIRIAREEAVLSLWNLPDIVLQAQTNGYPFGYVIPSSGTPLLTDCIAIVRGSKNKLEAIRFYEFVTSKAALITQANSFSRIPARKDIPPENLPGWMSHLELKPMTVNWSMIMMHEREWMRRWESEVKGKGNQ